MDLTKQRQDIDTLSHYLSFKIKIIISIIMKILCLGGDYAMVLIWRQIAQSGKFMKLIFPSPPVDEGRIL